MRVRARVCGSKIGSVVWQKIFTRSERIYTRRTSRCYCRDLPGMGNGARASAMHLPLHRCVSFFFFFLFLRLSLSLHPPERDRCSPTLRPRRPRHAQQTSPTTRSGRHAAFIMFPRSSFDGSLARSWSRARERTMGPLPTSAPFGPEKLPSTGVRVCACVCVILQLSEEISTPRDLLSMYKCHEKTHRF